MASDLTELLERVKAATGPDGGLDAAICAELRYIGALGDQHMWTRNWKGPIEAHGDRVVLIYASGKSGPWTKAPAITASLDAALALVERVLPGWTWEGGKAPEKCWAYLYPDINTPGRSEEGANPALAICAVLLATLAAQPDVGSAQVGENDVGR